MTAWPARGDRVVPSASYFGQVTIMPVMPFAGVPPPDTGALSEIGQALIHVTGSMVPARLFDKGWLKAS